MFEGLEIECAEKFTIIPMRLIKIYSSVKRILNKKRGNKIVYFSNMIKEKGYEKLLEIAIQWKIVRISLFFRENFDQKISKSFWRAH